MKKRAVCAAAAALLVGALALPAQASGLLAADPIDAGEELSLTVWLEYEGEPLEGIAVSVYRTADVSSQGGVVRYTALAGEIDYTGMTAAESSRAAQELVSLAAGGAFEGYSGTADAAGTVTFSGMEAGMYLVVCASDVQYTFEPFLAAVPQAEEQDGRYTWNTQVVCEPKAGIIQAQETQTVITAGVQTGDAGAGHFAAAAVLAAAVLFFAVCRRRINQSERNLKI